MAVFINFQNLLYFDVNLLNLQMYYFPILHISMCGVCSPPVLGDLTTHAQTGMETAYGAAASASTPL